MLTMQSMYTTDTLCTAFCLAEKRYCMVITFLQEDVNKHLTLSAEMAPRKKMLLMK